MATEDELKRALKAFKKRLKLTRLDEESRLSKSPLSKGASGIVAITPPTVPPAPPTLLPAPPTSYTFTNGL